MQRTTDVVPLIENFLEQQGLTQTYSALKTELQFRRLNQIIDETDEKIDTITDSTASIKQQIDTFSPTSPKSPNSILLEERTKRMTEEKKYVSTFYDYRLFPYLEGQLNLASIDIVFVTYQSFTTSLEFLYILLRKYYDGDVDVQMRVVTALEELIIKYYLKYENWESTKKVRQEFLAEVWYFINAELDSFGTGKGLRDALTQFRAKIQGDYNMKRRIANKVLLQHGGKKDFDNIGADVLAIHLTHIERLKFASIEPQEFLNLRWSKSKTKHLAPNILVSTKRFDKLAFWITSLIVTCSDSILRVHRLEKIIEIAKQLYTLKNFQNMQAVLAGIRHSSSHRMKKTFAKLQPSAAETLKMLQSLSNSNFAAIRAVLQEAIQSGYPAIPFLGVVQSDLTFVEEGNKENILNRCEMTYKILSDIILLQESCAQRGASIELDYAVMWVLESQQGRIDDENELLKQSKARE